MAKSPVRVAFSNSESMLDQDPRPAAFFRVLSPLEERQALDIMPGPNIQVELIGLDPRKRSSLLIAPAGHCPPNLSKSPKSTVVLLTCERTTFVLCIRGPTIEYTCTAATMPHHPQAEPPPMA
jgi:hypothetical protein